MAEFIRGTGQKVTPLKHSYDIFEEYMLNMYFNTLCGKEGSGKPIILDNSLFDGRNAGDVGRYHFIPQNRTEGIEGQNPSVLGNEDELDEYYMDLRIDQVAKAFRKKGKMTTIRMIWDFRARAKSQLANWFRMRTENDLIDGLTGVITDGAAKLSGAELLSTPLVSGLGRCIRPDVVGGNLESKILTPANTSINALLGDMAPEDKLNTGLLDVLQDFAKTANEKYAIKPIRAKDGEEYYILVVHPRAAIDLRSDPRWEKRAVAAMTGKGSLEGDAIATGAIGVWGKIIIKEANFVRATANKGGTLRVANNLLLGADASVMAYAQHLDYTEELLDHNRVLSVAADEIRGTRKVTFDGVDLNVAQVPTAIRI